MRKFIFAVCVLCFSVAAVADVKISVEAQVNAQVNALSKAMVNADKEALSALTSENLVYGHSSGRVENQAEFVENLVNGNSNFLTMELKDQTVDVFGDTAVVRHILTGETDDKGKGLGAVNIGVMLVWAKENNNWVVVARQAYKLPK